MSDAVFPGLIADIEARDALGRATYGKELKTFDGRDSLLDAYEEALDMAVYLKKARMEHAALLDWAKKARMEHAALLAWAQDARRKLRTCGNALDLLADWPYDD